MTEEDLPGAPPTGGLPDLFSVLLVKNRGMAPAAFESRDHDIRPCITVFTDQFIYYLGRDEGLIAEREEETRLQVRPDPFQPIIDSDDNRASHPLPIIRVDDRGAGIFFKEVLDPIRLMPQNNNCSGHPGIEDMLN